VDRVRQANGDFDRVIAPWLADVAIIVVSAVLVERAFRRDASAFVYPAALGVMIAATDFNFTYLSDSTEIGLLA
jgi:ABC-type Co2+ transport system permease subunit